MLELFRNSRPTWYNTGFGCMGKFFTHERFGRPQVLAGLFLLVFLAQGIWLVHQELRTGQVDADELFRIQEGLRQWRHGPARVWWVAGTNMKAREMMHIYLPTGLWENDGWDQDHSPLWYLVASAPLLAWPRPLDADSFHHWGWLARAPYLMFGAVLGASLWYVARRLYGNAGGYIALALYCFSPAMIRSSALWSAQPEMGAAWGAFGAIFTAIAVAHTLYAPREVVMWNWRRILLLGLSFAVAVGSQFSLLVVVPLALAFMLYLAPTRRDAALAIWVAGCAIAFLLLYSSYMFQERAFSLGMSHARFFGITWQAYGMALAYGHILTQLGQSSPALVVALPVVLTAYIAWPRTRYFGNSAPLLVAILFLLLGLASPHHTGLGFELMALPFLFVFVGGVSADLLETRQRGLALACIWALLVANAAWSLWELARVA